MAVAQMLLALFSAAQAAEFQFSLLERSASTAQLQMQAENLRAMWLDYKASEHELRGHEPSSSSLIEMKSQMTSRHQQELMAKRDSAKVLEAMSMSLEALNENAQNKVAKKEATSTLAVHALGEVQSMDADAMSIAESAAEERLVAESKRTAQTADQTAEAWLEAFVKAEDAELRTAVAETEDAFRHLTGQRNGMETVDKAQDFFRANGVKTNTFGTNKQPVTRDDILRSMDITQADKDQAADDMLQQMDKDQDGKITWQETVDFYSNQLEEERKHHVASLAQMVTSEPTNKDAVARVTETFKDGLVSQLALLDSTVTKALTAKPQEIKPAALLEETGEKKKELGGASVEKRLTAEAEAMKATLEMELMQYVDAAKRKESEEKTEREKRWAKVLERQQTALLQQERAVKAEEQELVKLEREEQWQKSQIVRQKQKVEDASCRGQQSTVRAFIATNQDHTHAACLKSQIGTCVTTDLTEVASMKCNEPSAGWQKKCLVDKAEEMADCAPMGVDWNAMLRGEKGNAADNAALERLSEWCTMHRTLDKIQQSNAAAAFSLLLGKNAALSKDAVAKLTDFGENFKGQDWDLLEVDPTGSPAPLHSVLVKSASAGKIKKAMSLMKAIPLDRLPKALNDDPKFGSKAVAWNAGVSGMLDKASQDCSLESLALLRTKA